MGICATSGYCISTTLTSYTGYNGTYTATGVYDTYLYYTGGSSSTYYIYFNTGTTNWCVSNTLGGSCFLFGSNVCYTDCPDLDSSFYSSGICPSPTPSMTPHCEIDFISLFDCNVIPTPSPTRTSTPTPTPTITPTSSNPCPVGAEVFINFPTATPSPTQTQTPSSTNTGTCANTIEEYIFEVMTGNIICKEQNKYKVCSTGEIFFTSDPAIWNGVIIDTGSTFQAIINNFESQCITYLGVEINQGSQKRVSLVLSASNCNSCVPVVSQSPTPTMTPTPTRTSTPTPTPSQTTAVVGLTSWYVYVKCGGENIFVIQQAKVQPNNLSLVPGNIFAHSPNTTNTPFDCFTFLGVYFGSSSAPPGNLVPPNASITTNNGNYFTSTPNFGFKVDVDNNGNPTPFTDCSDCLLST